MCVLGKASRIVLLPTDQSRQRACPVRIATARNAENEILPPSPDLSVCAASEAPPRRRQALSPRRFQFSLEKSETDEHIN